MKENETKGRVFPEGFEHVEDRLNETKQHLKDIDERIESVPPDQGPTLQINPPGFLKSRQPGSQLRTVTFLKDAGERIKTEAWEKTEADTRDADHKSRRSMRDKIREELFPNPFRTMGEGELAKVQHENRDLEASQDMMDAKIARHLAAKGQDQPEQPGDTLDKPEVNNMSMSARFSMSLGYTKATIPSPSDPSPTGPSRSRNREPDKDMD